MTKELYDALKEVMIWISNWDPNFTQDEQWYETKTKVDAVLDRYENG